MALRPSPPDELPKYLAEGVPKQDNDTLHELQDWINDLLEYRQDVAADEIDADTGEEIQDVQESSGGTVVIKKVSCGKDSCKCQSGELHGPYKYIVRRQGDSLDWEYKGPVTEQFSADAHELRLVADINKRKDIPVAQDMAGADSFSELLLAGTDHGAEEIDGKSTVLRSRILTTAIRRCLGEIGR